MEHYTAYLILMNIMNILYYGILHSYVCIVQHVQNCATNNGTPTMKAVFPLKEYSRCTNLSLAQQRSFNYLEVTKIQ